MHNGFFDENDTLYLEYSNAFYTIDTNIKILRGRISNIKYQFDLNGISHLVSEGPVKNELIDKYFDSDSKDSLSMVGVQLFYKEINSPLLYKKMRIRWKYDLRSSIENQYPIPNIDSF